MAKIAKQKEGPSLVIVESPAKAKTINKYLGKNYVVKSSMGHVRDLPKSKIGVDLEHAYIPQYQVIKARQKMVTELKKAAEKAGKIYLAPDPDREGEAIAWHLSEIISDDKEKIFRVTFNEITKKAVTEAFNHPTKLNLDRVESQQTRRILDRIMGYKLSPLLWKKVGAGLSAGRVQSVALRIICEREEEILKFVPKEYWSLEADFAKKKEPTAPFRAALDRINGEKFEIPNGEEANKIVADLQGATYEVKSVDKKDKTRHPYPPLITSTLQQAAVNRLGWSVSKTMLVAQQLYEGLEIGEEAPVGLITYMRTDSFNISGAAIAEVRHYIPKKYGADFLPEKPNFYRSRKGAQEAHEAIRPTSVSLEPESIHHFLTKDQFMLYRLVWERFVASQMADAKLLVTSIDIEAGKYSFRASGTEVVFPGFLKVSGEVPSPAKKKTPKAVEAEGVEDEKDVVQDKEKEDAEEKEEAKFIPPLEVGEKLNLKELIPAQHFTKPPARFSEATLVKALEEQGIGRPSTYAPTILTIIKRNYVAKERGRLKPSDLGKIVTNLLVENFPDLINVDFTAHMEEELDEIEDGKLSRNKVLDEFYQPFSKDLEKATANIKVVKREAIPTNEVCEKCGKMMVIKFGRRGEFMACSGYPECKSSKSIPTGLICPHCQGNIIKCMSKRGKPFYGCSGYPNCKFIANTPDEAKKKGATGELKSFIATQQPATPPAEPPATPTAPEV